MSTTEMLQGVGVVFGLVLGAGLLAGQFRRGVVKELRNALESALTEIKIQRERGDRQDEDLKSLTVEVAGLRKENEILRSVLISGEHFREVVAEEIGRGVARMIEVLQK